MWELFMPPPCVKIKSQFLVSRMISFQLLLIIIDHIVRDNSESMYKSNPFKKKKKIVNVLLHHIIIIWMGLNYKMAYVFTP